MTHPHEPTPRTSVIPSRRAVLRTAAWSLPAIQIAAATPAFAISPPALALSPAPTGQWAVNFSTQTMSGVVGVTNQSSSATTSGLRVTVTLPNPYVRTPAGANAVVSIAVISSGWTATGVSYNGSGSARTGTFVLTTGNQLPPGATGTVVFRVNLIDRIYYESGFPDPVTVLATATGYTQAAGSIIPA